jgi:hypothetical protein
MSKFAPLRVLAAVMLALASAAALWAQASQTPAAPPSPVANCPSTPTLDALIAALDTAISGPASKDRTCFRGLMLPTVRLIPISAATGQPHLLTVDDWITAVAKNGDEMVTEKQLKFQSETFGRIAHLWSTYETTLAGKPRTRGINSIQAVFDGQNWHIIEVVWQAETPDSPVPAQYLP